MSEAALIIDPPVGLGSSPADIRAWIHELEGMESAPEVEFELARAQRFLAAAEKLEPDNVSPTS